MLRDCSAPPPLRSGSQKPKVRTAVSAVQLAALHSVGPGYSCQQEGRNFLGMFFLEVKSPFPLGQ